ncbi:glycoside hydrolase family 13 protein [Paenibacillus herberti]|uniref:Alpha-glycosidase n=1 Tax=Paenibacillus herberti TaxID=1619309 RepID=A0A229NUJ2_9BACL|nr:glycoside hydrolase family 13 protein [Paenibacillus herberti]OXM13552.1 alpha-glycosidase [Paenibacillus herberti]
MLTQEAIYHVPKDEYCYALDSTTIRVTIRVRRTELKSGKILLTDRYAHERFMPPTVSYDLRLAGNDKLFDYWFADLTIESRRPKYLFQLFDGSDDNWFSEEGLTDVRPEMSWFEFPYIAEADVIRHPEWFQEAIFYQIGVDRFFNGDKENDPPGVLPWGEAPTMTTFFGGDLDGIIEKLDYLTELGINALYLNPIFLAPSTFKYDTADYYQIDPQFGGNPAFDRLLGACHERGIRVVLDAVFNHAGLLFEPFRSVIEHGPRSAYYDWFYIREWPLEMEEPKQSYDTFSFTARMPKLRHEHPDVRRYLLSVAAYWTRKGIDGWRLDVANEIDHAFWREFRQVVRGINSEAFILGEVWLDGTTWLQGDQFDSITNYRFRSAVLDFFAYGKIGVSQFDEKLFSARIRYRAQTNLVMFNLIGSHDVPRILDLCDDSAQRVKLATAFMFAYPGIPMIYYGDEVAMKGGDFVQARHCMVWEPERQNREMLELYRSCTRWRREYAPLVEGEYRKLFADDALAVYGFARELPGEAVWAFFHNAPGEAVIRVEAPEGLSFVNIATGETVQSGDGGLEVKLDAFGFTLFYTKTSGGNQ